MSNISKHREVVEVRPAREAGMASLARDYRVSHFFVVRSPAFPLNRLQEWSSEPLPDFEPANASEGWARRRTELAARLRSASSERWLRSAIYFASPELEAWISAQAERSELPPKLCRTLLRYFMRAAGRETPFGL